MSDPFHDAAENERAELARADARWGSEAALMQLAAPAQAEIERGDVYDLDPADLRKR